jgi:peptidyl-prolyl cis-trans isomerase A (cyclophilin A)
MKYLLVLLLGLNALAEAKVGIDHVVLVTSVGQIEIDVYSAKAPVSAKAFLSFVDNGRFAQEGTFYRVVRKGVNDHGKPEIDVIQGGFVESDDKSPGIAHESTDKTGLKHVDGTVSLARGAVGTATGGAFFICIGAQPGLDYGGLRNPDKQGFAAFGRVTKGMDVVRKIQHLPPAAASADPYTKGQVLAEPVRILKAFRQH